MSSTSTSNSSPLTSSSAFLANDTFAGFRLEIKLSFQAVFKAQEEHCWSSEERQEEIMLWWMEVRWEEQMLERDLVAATVNMQSARMVGEKVAVEIRK